MKAQIFNYRFWIKETTPNFIHQKLRIILSDSGFKILQSIEHYFDPYGYTALFLLGESHLAIHTFPEENKSYIELSSCNANYFNIFKKTIRSDSEITVLEK